MFQSAKQHVILLVYSKVFIFRQNGAPSGLENRGLDAKHLPQNKKTNRRNVMKRKVYVGMDVHKETISIAYLT
ncbi:hypothetical protein LEP1GSC193_3867, partial [Leptospira alstonii serovar Pingchang str. 80-412]